MSLGVSVDNGDDVFAAEFSEPAGEEKRARITGAEENAIRGRDGVDQAFPEVRKQVRMFRLDVAFAFMGQFYIAAEDGTGKGRHFASTRSFDPPTNARIGPTIVADEAQQKGEMAR